MSIPCMYNAQGQLVCPTLASGTRETFIQEKSNDQKGTTSAANKKQADPLETSIKLLDTGMFCQAILTKDPITGQIVIHEFKKECPLSTPPTK